MFLLVSGRHVGAHPDGHRHGVSTQISINLSKTFSAYQILVKMLEVCGKPTFMIAKRQTTGVFFHLIECVRQLR